MRIRPSALPLGVPSFALGALLLQVAPASAQTLTQPTLRADIEMEVGTPSTSATTLLATAGSRALFSASNLQSNATLWITDALGLSATQIPQTDQGLNLTTDALAGGGAAALPNGNFVVRASVGGLGIEPVVVDPAGPAATLLVDLLPGSGSSGPESLVSWLGEVWFIAFDGTSRSLYSTDGTAAGTVLRSALPAQLNRNALVATPGPLFIALRETFGSSPGDALYSLANPGAAPALVRSGTVDAPFFNSLDIDPVVLGSRLLFGLDDGSTGTEPWISDGTPQGTSALGDLSPGTAGSSPRFIEQVNGTALFAASNSSTAYEYYLTDGSSAGTALLGDLNPGFNSGATSTATAAVVAGQFLLAVDTPGAGTELWSAGTTPGSAALVADLVPGPAGSSPRNFQAFGGLAYFRAIGSSSGSELFVSDGTPQGTGLAVEIAPGQVGSLPEPLAALPWGLLIEATGPQGREPYVSDGTSAGTTLLVNTVEDLNNGSSSPRNFLRFQDRVVFGAETQELGRELYQLRLGEAQVELLADLEPGAASAEARPILATEEFFLFTKSTLTGSGGSELWSSNGVPGSELKLVDLEPAVAAPPAAQLGDEAYVIARLSGQTVPSLLRTDGTFAGSTVVLDGLVDIQGPLVEFGGSLWFRAAEAGTGLELWKTDGTTAGTGLVQQLALGPASGTQLIVATDNWLAAAGSGTLPTVGLFAFDAQGNSEPIGTNISTGNQNFSVMDAAAFGGQLVFSARVFNSPSKTGIFVSDGTDAGTIELNVTSPGDSVAETQGFVGAGDRAYFWTLNDGDVSWNLWTTQGSQASTVLIGTYQLQTFGQLPISSAIAAGAPLGSSGQAVYALSTVDKVTRLFVAEPTLGGLTLPTGAESEILFDGLEGFQQAVGARLGSELLFSASDQLVGFELHALPIVELDGYVAETFGSSCGSAQIGSQGEARVGSAFSVELDAQPLSAAGLFVAFDTNFQDLVPGCQALIGNSALLASRVTDGAGDAQVDLTIPALPSLAGVAFYSQWAVLSAGGPVFGFAELTDGLEVILGS